MDAPLHAPRVPALVSRLALAAIAAVFGACTTIVVPPPAPHDAVTVFVIDHGRTPSLVLPATDGNLVRYAYGDWNWYALRQTGLSDGLRALFVRSQGALGRQVLAGPASPASIRQQVSESGVDDLHTLPVERRAVEGLLARLEDEHRKGREQAVAEALGFTFVPHPQPYTAARNSNHAVADWLRALGAEVRGPPFPAQWHIGESAQAP